MNCPETCLGLEKLYTLGCGPGKGDLFSFAEADLSLLRERGLIDDDEFLIGEVEYLYIKVHSQSVTTICLYIEI